MPRSKCLDVAGELFRLIAQQLGKLLQDGVVAAAQAADRLYQMVCAAGRRGLCVRLEHIGPAPAVRSAYAAFALSPAYPHADRYRRQAVLLPADGSVRKPQKPEVCPP